MISLDFLTTLPDEFWMKFLLTRWTLFFVGILLSALIFYSASARSKSISKVDRSKVTWLIFGCILTVIHFLAYRKLGIAIATVVTASQTISIVALWVFFGAMIKNKKYIPYFPILSIVIFLTLVRSGFEEALIEMLLT